MAAAPCSAFLAALGISLAGCATPPPVAGNHEAGAFTSLASEGVIVDAVAARDLISIYRANHGLAPLTIDPDLQAAARAKAQAMAAANSASGGVTGVQRALVVSNVSAGYHTVADAFSGWRGAPQQNANMLNARARRMGIATVYAPGSKYRVFWALVLTD